MESRAGRFLEMAALILSGGAPKGISPAPRLSSCFALSRSHSVSVIKLGTYRVAAKSAKTRVMSTTSSKPKPARCSEVRFAEVDFPGVIQSRLVIEYTDGLKIIVGSHDDLHLAADLISELRRRQRKGARK